MRKLLSICLAGFFTLAADAGQSVEIEWSATRLLTWADFVGPVPAGADPERVAATAASLSWSYGYALELSGDGCTYQILNIDSAAKFHPDESWVRPGNKTPSVLMHEQGHFDIAERYKKQFEERTRELVHSTRPCRGGSKRKSASYVERDLEQLVGSIYEEVWRDYRSEQDAYDEATRHGMNGEVQAQWTQRLKLLREPTE